MLKLVVLNSKDKQSSNGQNLMGIPFGKQCGPLMGDIHGLHATYWVSEVLLDQLDIARHTARPDPNSATSNLTPYFNQVFGLLFRLQAYDAGRCNHPWMNTIISGIKSSRS